MGIDNQDVIRCTLVINNIVVGQNGFLWVKMGETYALHTQFRQEIFF